MMRFQCRVLLHPSESALVQHLMQISQGAFSKCHRGAYWSNFATKLDTRHCSKCQRNILHSLHVNKAKRLMWADKTIFPQISERKQIVTKKKKSSSSSSTAENERHYFSIKIIYLFMLQTESHCLLAFLLNNRLYMSLTGIAVSLFSSRVSLARAPVSVSIAL